MVIRKENLVGLKRAEYQKIQWGKNHRINGNNNIERQCTQCKEWLEENYDNFYYKNKSKPELGFSPECKRCGVKRSTIIKDNNRERYLDYFSNRYYSTKEEFIAQVIENAKKNPEMHKRNQRNWRQRNPEKCRWYASLHRNHDITKSEEEALLKIFDYSCAYCGMTLEEHKRKFGQKLHNDHVDEDGYNDLRNDVPACVRCNCSKHESELEEWYFKQSFYNEDKYNKIIWWITDGYRDYIEDKPSYRITRKQNEDKKTFHAELWSIDIMRNMIECIAVRNKKKDIIKDIQNGIIPTPEYV